MRKAILLMVIVLALAMTAPAFAGGQGNGKGGGKKSNSSISLVVVTDANGDGQPNWGDQVTFEVSTTATSQPHVNLTCSQNGVVVYGAVTGYYDGYPWPWTQVMTLSSTMWSGGAADCSAQLSYHKRTRIVNLASISFTVGA